MLASLLPGVRELRAPLAAGYLWLIFGWLAFAGAIPRPAQAKSGLFSDIYYLGGAAGVTATAAAVTFSAYLLGVLSLMGTASAAPMIRGLRRRRMVFGKLNPGVAVPSPAGRYALRQAVLDQLDVRYSSDDDELKRRLGRLRDDCGETRRLTDPHARRVLLDVGVDVDAYVKEIADNDLAQLPLRLLGDEIEREVYGEFDRLRAESEFRAAVAPPLAAIVAILAWRTTPWAALALVVPILIFVDAVRTASAAADILAEAVWARDRETPVLKRVREDPRLRYRADWMRLAAELGYAPAMVKWAETLKAKDERAGSEGWFRKAADQGNRDAMFGLAGLLHRRHHPDAEQWYAAAANAGHPVAQEIRALGDQRPDEVADLKSAHAGDAAAMTRVGKRYAAMGDVDEADRWYQRGAEAGHRPASEALAESLERRGMKSAAESWRPTRS